MRILLGISGSIAAYKSAELCRLLCKAGHQVRVVMTASACNFIAPLTLQALSGHPVATELLDGDQEAAMGHIALARWAELLLIAPASANTLARLAAGLADDLLSAICLATEAPLWLAPAMNSQMWQHPATQANLALLRGRGASVLGPEAGDLACGEQGAGRMLEPEAILEFLLESLLLQGCKVLLTAGPTQEPLDPVRFLGNRSSGKMGFALAQALVEAGAQVRLVSGPVRLATPAGVERTDVTTAAQMHQAVMQALAETGWHVFIGCAAVADYRPERQAADKIKKTQAPMMLRLVPNPDILAEVAALPPGQRPFCLGFAAETSELAAQAEAKRRRKGVELLAANLVGGPVGGFEADDNALTLFWEGGSQELPLLPKLALARRLVALLAQHLGRVQAPT
jgi:phosphopantothenoylcysteine decarboxylase/phosphopantothenate--cysteine ligase